MPAHITAHPRDASRSPVFRVGGLLWVWVMLVLATNNEYAATTVAK